MSSRRALTSTLCALAIALLPCSATARPLNSSPRFGVSIVWSLHEPWTARDAGGNVFAKPDLRFHVLRDVRPMAAMVARFPGLHVAFDLSPVLLEQLDAYDHGAIDRALLVANRPADRLSETDKAQIEATLLQAPESVFQRFPAYRALRAKPRAQYSAQDWRDLQVWHLLAWLDAAERTQAPFVDLVLQRHGFTEAQKLMALYRARQLLADTISLYRRLQDSGAVEIATSPYYHPFLPMIVGEAIASPSSTAGRRFEFPQDASDQLSMACESYRQLFGRPARGMVPVAGAWPESLSPMLEPQGVRWLLAANEHPTTGSGAARISALDGLDGTSGEDARTAARTLLARLHGMATTPGAPRWAVVHVDVADLVRRFPGGEDAFVSEVYRGVLSGHWADTVTPSEGLARYGRALDPSTVRRPATWVDAQGARREWNVLQNARRTLELYRREHGETFRYAKAHRLMLAAESSDWFTAARRDDRFPPEFEQLITDAYQAIGAPADAVLQQSVSTATGSVDVRPNQPPTILMVAIPDATGDALGAGQLVAPLDPRMPVEDFDLRQLEVAESGDQWVFTIYLGALDNPWHAPNGLGLPTLDLYLSSQSSPGTASALLSGRGAYGDRLWSQAIVLEGFQSGLYAPNGMRLQALNPEVDAWHKRVVVRVPKQELGGSPANWRYLLISLAQDAFSSGRVRPLSPRPDLFHFSGHGAPILDVLTTDASQSELLAPKNQRVVLPFVAPPSVRARPIVDRVD